MDERWLVTGACGQLGAHVMERLRRTTPAPEVLGLGRRPCSRHGTVLAVDVCDTALLDRLLGEYRPTHVVHLAGVTSPAAAAGDPEAAWAANVEVAVRLAAWSASDGAWLLYPSTDFVWSGEHGRRWRESDLPQPRSPYAEAKLVAEREVLVRGGCVVRFSLLYGDPRCPRETTWTRLREAFAAGEEVPACTDEYRTPLPLETAAEVVVELGRRDHRGLLHAAGPEVATPYGLFTRWAGALGATPTLRPVSRAVLPAGAQRPANMAMDAGLLRRTLPHVELPSVGQALGVPGPASVPVAVIIPAYHGAAVLSRSLGALGRQDYPGPMHVVVAVNDSRDDTWAAAHAQAAAFPGGERRCEVIRTARGRQAAFNEAERHVDPGAVRLYLDQDADLSTGAVRSIAEETSGGTVERFLALPLHLTGVRSAVSRVYYRGWSQLPYVRSSPVTIGAYAVSAGGRARWGPFPELQSDDKYVRTRFRLDERVVVQGEWYSVRVPEGWRDLVRARRRYARGNRELRRAGATDEVARYRGIAELAVRRPSRLLELGTVALVHLLARLGAGRRREEPLRAPR